jgi:hypothetical protein
MTSTHKANRSPVQVLTDLRDDLRIRREARLSHRELERELAHYTSPNDVDDLMAALREEDSQGAEEIRAILSRNLFLHQTAS